MPKVTAHLTTETLDACNARGSVSGALNRITARYAEACRLEDIEDAFTPAQLDAIREALNGWQADPASTIDGGPALKVESALDDGLADRHDIDGVALIADLRSFTYAQNVALVDAVERYWHAVSAAHDQSSR